MGQSQRGLGTRVVTYTTPCTRGAGRPAKQLLCECSPGVALRRPRSVPCSALRSAHNHPVYPCHPHPRSHRPGPARVAGGVRGGHCEGASPPPPPAPPRPGSTHLAHTHAPPPPKHLITLFPREQRRAEVIYMRLLYGQPGRQPARRRRVAQPRASCECIEEGTNTCEIRLEFSVACQRGPAAPSRQAAPLPPSASLGPPHC